MFKSIRIGSFYPIERFFNWFWTMSGTDAFLSFVLLSFALTTVYVPGFAYTVWSNPLITGVVIVEMLYLEYWQHRTKPTKNELLQKENGELKEQVRVQRELLEQKMNTIEALIYTNERLKRAEVKT